MRTAWRTTLSSAPSRKRATRWLASPVRPFRELKCGAGAGSRRGTSCFSGRGTPPRLSHGPLAKGRSIEMEKSAIAGIRASRRHGWAERLADLGKRSGCRPEARAVFDGIEGLSDVWRPGDDRQL